MVNPLWIKTQIIGGLSARKSLELVIQLKCI